MVDTNSDQDLYVDLFTNAPVGYHAIGPDGVIIAMNDTELSLLGYARKEIIGKKSWKDLVATVDKKLFESCWKRIRNGHRIENEEFRFLRKDKTMVHVLLSSTPRLDEDGTFLNSRGIVVDISDKKLMDEAFAQLNKRYELIFDSVGEGIVGLNKKGIVTFANPAALQMLGYKFEHFINKPFHSLVHHSHVDSTAYPLQESPIYQSIQDGILRQSNEGLFWRKNGTSLAVEYISSPIIESGNATGAVVTFRDESSRRKALAALQKAEEKIGRLTQTIPLTENEKEVLYGIISYPTLNDTELAKILHIKRSTVTAIRTKLLKEEYYASYRLPNFELLGCEMLSVVTASFNPTIQDPVVKFRIFKDLEKKSEKIHVVATETDVLCLASAQNLTEFRTEIEAVFADYRKRGLLDRYEVVHFPFSLVQNTRLWHYQTFLRHHFDIRFDDYEIEQKTYKPRPLTKKEQEIFVALVKYNSLNDSEIAEVTKLSRPSISQTRRKLIDDGYLTVVNVPQSLQINCELAVLRRIEFNARVAQNDIDSAVAYVAESPATVLMLADSNNLFAVSVFEDYSQYNMVRNQDRVFFRSKNVIEQLPEATFMPLAQIRFELFDFSRLVKKQLGC